MSDQAARGVGGAHPVHVPVQLQPIERVEVLHQGAAHGSSNPVAQQHLHPNHESVMAPYHDPHEALKSDAPRHGIHDGTMYAQGEWAECVGCQWRKRAAQLQQNMVSQHCPIHTSAPLKSWHKTTRF